MTSPFFRYALRWLLSVVLLSLPAAAAPPAAPTGFTLTWNSNGSLSASWTDQSNNEEGFYIGYRLSAASSFSTFDEAGPNTTTFNGTPSSWPGLTSFQWAVFSFKTTGTTEEVSTASNIVTVTSPPYMSSVKWISASVGESFTHALTTAQASPVWTATSLPPGLTLNAGTISGIPTAGGRYTVNITLTSGGKTLNTSMRIYVFRPVPALVPPANGAAFTNRTLRRGAAATTVDLATHFNDPDVTEATRLVFNMGTIDFLYYPTAAPATVANFKGYVSRGDFVNTIIHRSMPDFVLQGGGYKAEAGTPSITRQPAVVNEPEISNTRGTVAMAKSGGNPDSATSEYFISLADNASNLNKQNEGFSVFARVPAAGMVVADGIAALTIKNYSTTNGVLTNCPVTNPPPAAFTPDSLVKMLSAGPVAPLSYTVQSSVPGVCGAAVNGAQLSLTPLAAGTAVITVTATDLDSQSINRTFNVTVEERLSDWLTAQSFPNGGDAAATADPDHDTAQNIMEFALMTNPQAGVPAPSPVAATTTAGADKFLTLSFPVRKLTGSGFVYAVESHNTLTGAWTQVWKSTDGFGHAQVVSFTDQADRTNVTIRDTAPVTAGGQHFLRLRVTDTP